MNLRALGLVVCSGLLAGCFFDLGGFGGLTRVDPLIETVVLGEAGPKVVLVDVQGMISEEQRRSPFGLRAPSMVANIREVLDLAAEDDEVAALLLRVQSPGGTVAASETIHHDIARWKTESGKPVVAYFQGIATSGGYYVGAASDHLVAHPTTVTGSIGVVMRSVNVSGLMEKLGVEDQTFTSGSFKDSGSPLRSMRDDEREQLQAVIDDLHERFREVVDAGRPNLDSAAVERLADGRIFTARQAINEGLIDEIGYLEEAVAGAERLAGIPESRVVSYHRPGEYRNNIYSHSSNITVQSIELNLLGGFGEYARPGFYYVWPAMFTPR